MGWGEKEDGENVVKVVKLGIIMFFLLCYVILYFVTFRLMLPYVMISLCVCFSYVWWWKFSCLK